MENINQDLDYYLSKGVLTGSRKFGVEEEGSDYDIAITSDEFQEIAGNLDEKSIILFGGSGEDWDKLKNRYNVLFQLEDGTKINLISYDTENALIVIEKINELMCSISKDKLNDKRFRYQLYEGFIDKYMTNEILGIPEISFNEDDIPFDLHCYSDMNSF